jgi:MFS family permease
VGRSKHQADLMSAAYKRYVVLLLLTIYIVNQTDRNIFSFLMEPIKSDLRLSDTQLGFVAGPAFVLLYALLGIPIARWGDRRNRIGIMTAAIAVWSCAAALFGAVRSFPQLSLTQAAIGIGEAGFSAIAISVIGDYHEDAAERAKALAIFMLAVPLSGIVTSLVAGWINEMYGWRTVFVLAAVPGVMLVALMKWTVREPPRRKGGTFAPIQGQHPPLSTVFSILWQRPALRHLAIGQSLASVVVSCANWLPPLFIRQFGMSTGELGNWFAVIYGLGGSCGVWLSGYLPGRRGLRGAGVEARLTAVATALIVPTLLTALWCPSRTIDLLILIPCHALLYFYMTPNMALVQTLVPAYMRATTASFFFLLQVIVGGAIGTQLVGFVSDRITPWVGNGAMALRWSMTLFSLIAFWAAWHFWRAGIYARRELAETMAPTSLSP